MHGYHKCGVGAVGSVVLGLGRRNRRYSRCERLGTIDDIVLPRSHWSSACFPVVSVAPTGAGLFYAVFIFGFRYAAPHGSPQAILFIAFATLVSTVIWQSDSEQTRAVLSASSWPVYAALGVLGAGLSFTFYVIGLKRATPVVASILAMVEPVTAALFGVMLLNETLVGTQIFGMVLIMLTVTALCVYSSVPRNA